MINRRRLLATAPAAAFFASIPLTRAADAVTIEVPKYADQKDAPLGPLNLDVPRQMLKRGFEDGRHVTTWLYVVDGPDPRFDYVRIYVTSDFDTSVDDNTIMFWKDYAPSLYEVSTLTFAHISLGDRFCRDYYYRALRQTPRFAIMQSSTEPILFSRLER